MTARTLVNVGLVLSLLVALLFLAVASENFAMRPPSHHSAGSAPLAAGHAENGTGNATQVISSAGSQAHAPNVGNRPVTVGSGGPADAGPDVVYQPQMTANSNSCGPRPCRRP